jgi:hypothetical protein
LSADLDRRTIGGPDAAGIIDDVRIQRLWMAVVRTDWRILALIGASQDIDTSQLAELFAQLVWRYRGQPSNVCDLRDLSMRLLDHEVREMKAQAESGTRVVVALRSISENPTAAPIARQADAAILCIALGETELRGAEETIAAIGRERVIGSVLLPDGPRRQPPTRQGR